MEPKKGRVSTLLYFTFAILPQSSVLINIYIYISNFMVVMLRKNSIRIALLAYDRKKQAICRAYFFEKFN